MENASEPENEILTAANEAGFFSRDRPLKAVLFSKCSLHFYLFLICKADLS